MATWFSSWSCEAEVWWLLSWCSGWFWIIANLFMAPCLVSAHWRSLCLINRNGFVATFMATITNVLTFLTNLKRPLTPQGKRLPSDAELNAKKQEASSTRPRLSKFDLLLNSSFRIYRWSKLLIVFVHVQCFFAQTKTALEREGKWGISSAACGPHRLIAETKQRLLSEGTPEEKNDLVFICHWNYRYV